MKLLVLYQMVFDRRLKVRNHNRQGLSEDLIMRGGERFQCSIFPSLSLEIQHSFIKFVCEKYVMGDVT